MNDFFEYMKWRGDLSFDAAPLNDVDALIFCQLSYMNLKGLIDEGFSDGITYCELAKAFKKSADYKDRCKLGLMINPKTITLFMEAAKTTRFGQVKVTGFSEKYSQRAQEQFCAVTNLITANTAFVAFRGTDDTLTGWKEDFNLAFMDEVPSQRDAVLYLKKACDSLGHNEIITGGHSKGGNLAIYASANMPVYCDNKIKAIYNFDGPGFLKQTLSSAPFMNVCTRIKSFYPQSSMIGMLFDHYSHYRIVKSRELLVMQHDPFSWNIKPVDFDTKEMLDSLSININSAFNMWFYQLTNEQRQNFVETIFKVLDTGEGETLSQMSKHWISNLGNIIKSVSLLDNDIREQSIDTLKLMFKAYLTKSFE